MEKFNKFVERKNEITAIQYLIEEKSKYPDLFALFEAVPPPLPGATSQLPPPLPQRQGAVPPPLPQRNQAQQQQQSTTPPPLPSYQSVAQNVDGYLDRLMKDRNLLATIQQQNGGSQMMQNLANAWKQFKNVIGQQNQPVQNQQQTQLIDYNKDPQGFLKQIVTLKPEQLIGNGTDRQQRGANLMNILKKYQMKYPNEADAAMNYLAKILS